MENQAHTHPHHPDETLRGRTYSIPFAKVWKAIRSVGLRRDQGLDHGEWPTRTWEFSGPNARGGLTRSLDEVEIRISLDENGQTRIDMSSTSRVERGDLGRNARRIRKFFRVLDQRVEASPGKIIDPTVPLIRTGVLYPCCPDGLHSIGRKRSIGPRSRQPIPPPPLETSRVEATKGLSRS